MTKSAGLKFEESLRGRINTVARIVQSMDEDMIQRRRN